MSDKPFSEQGQLLISLQLSTGWEQTDPGPDRTASWEIHLLPGAYTPLPAVEGSPQPSRESRGIPSRSEPPPQTAATQGDLTTHNTSCRLSGDEKPRTL